MNLDAMKQALEALELWSPALGHAVNKRAEAVVALRAAIKEAEKQEPVAWMSPSWINPDTRGWANDSFESIEIEGWIPLYTAPRQWQGLTDEEKHQLNDALNLQGRFRIIDAIEAKLKERNK